MSDFSSKSLDIPAPAIEAQDGREVARVWVGNGRVHTTIRTGIWDDPANWGVFLVDFARQVASAYQQVSGYDEQNALRRIRQAIEAEWDSPTDKH